MIDWILIVTIMSPTLQLHTHSVRFAHEKQCNKVLNSYLINLKMKGMAIKAMGVCTTDVVVPEQNLPPSRRDRNLEADPKQEENL